MWIWRAWHRLSTSRNYVTCGIGVPMGGTIINGRPLGITWETVIRWAEYNNLGRAETALLDYCIVQMDAVFIPKYHQKLEMRMQA
ncbi:hypothetical protein [Acetobacter sp.]|uniref:hypothetical protein n=1 Tax=Acetobacter sp. TaxID=440 RepID=UPI0039E87005